MRLIDADALLEKMKILQRNILLKFDIEDAPTIDLWHYPSKGEYPPSGEEVLCWLWGTTPDVGCWNEKDKLWHFDEFEEEDVDCWQYIIPPKEEA